MLVESKPVGSLLLVFPVLVWGEFQMMPFVQSLSELICLCCQVILQDEQCRVFIRFGAPFALIGAART